MRETLSTGAPVPEGVAHFPTMLRRFRQVIRRGVAAGELRKVDPSELYLHLIGSLAFFFATAPARERLRGKLPIAVPRPASYVRFVQDGLARILTPSTSGENR